MKKKGNIRYMKKFIIIFVASLFLTFFSQKGIASDFDGNYSAAFDFKMGPASVCPSVLPIEIVIEIKDGNAEGYIFNNGGSNSHGFCKLYHNGPITGTIGDDGKVKFKIKQNDPHSIQYSSYLISGNIDGKLNLMSRSAQYHPPHKFELSKIDTARKKERN